MQQIETDTPPLPRTQTKGLELPRYSVRILSGFEDPGFTREDWNGLLAKGQTNTVNLTWEWQKSWWEAFGKGRLMLILVKCKSTPIALAPFFSDQGMLCNLCPEDAIDMVGDIGEAAVLDLILSTAMEAVDEFIGFRMHFIPESSDTPARFRQSAERLGLSFHEEYRIPSPFLDIRSDREHAVSMTRKKSLRRHENFFLREGGLEVDHMQMAEEILPHLDDFFHQHTKRRSVTDAPSLFEDEAQRNYYRELTSTLSDTGWLRFTRIGWRGTPIAFHYGLSYKGRYLYGIPSFDLSFAEHSPGEVLLKRVMEEAIEEGADSFDFGIGDEAYKYRFANGSLDLVTFGLYPSNTDA
jgi:CelD/BcsL family acetyltransferase involved in cellulose biosynthesis